MFWIMFMMESHLSKVSEQLEILASAILTLYSFDIHKDICPLPAD